MSRELSALKKKIGTRIRNRRLDLQLSQEELAFKVDLSATYLSQIEHGARNPSLDALFKLSAALQMNLTDLVQA